MNYVAFCEKNDFMTLGSFVLSLSLFFLAFSIKNYSNVNSSKLKQLIVVKPINV